MTITQPTHDQLVRSIFSSAGVEVCQGEAYDADTLERVELTREERAAWERIRLENLEANVAARHEGLVLVDAKRLEKLELLAKQEALRTLGRWASNPELSFDWYSAAICSQRIRQQAQ